MLSPSEWMSDPVTIASGNRLCPYLAYGMFNRPCYLYEGEKLLTIHGKQQVHKH
jgi:hypothetical protein